MTHISEHFSEEEALCSHCEDLPGDAREGAIRLANEVLEPLRIQLNEWTEDDRDVMIYVTSWYRCPEHNDAVGGVPNSRHLEGLAADIIPVSSPPMDLTKLRMRAAGIAVGLDGTSVIFYAKHLHVDIRKRPVYLVDLEV